jgi:hypothetical protein
MNREELAKQLVAEVEVEVVVESLTAGERVEVNWGRRGWLPGTFESLSTPDPGEDFQRARVCMDNGLSCDGSGYHPRCVRRPNPERI